MKCVDCPYYWKDMVEVPIKLDDGGVDYTMEEVDGVAYCHYEWNDDCAPCEVNESDD